MRLPDDRRRLRFLRSAFALSAGAALGACAMGSAADELALAAAPVNGPQADYPVVIGAPYAIAGTSYTPDDVLNYDEVGYLAAEAGGGAGISGAHHTLPLPSYVEVTSLATGRTILVRLERRGPMDGNQLIALSPGALAQLDTAAGTPVRVRRVNPPEEQRALLRSGQRAPQRIDTPTALVEVLKRKLPAEGSAPLSAPQVATAAQPASPAAAASPPSQPATGQAPQAGPPALPPLQPRGAAPVVASASNRFEQAFTPPAAAPARPVQTVTGGFVVQAGAFSTADRADRVADALDARVSRAGNLYRVRTGPFATRSEAEASLAKVRAAGYREARIQTSG